MQNHIPSTRSKTGRLAAFSLVELLVVTSILGIMVSVALVNYLRDLSKQNLYRSAGQVETMIKDAQSKAIGGYLGGDISADPCDELANVQVSGSSGQLTEILNCAEGRTITVTQLPVPADYSLSNTFQINYSPFGRVELRRDSILVPELIFALQSNSNQVNFTLNQGGTLSISYE